MELLKREMLLLKADILEMMEKLAIRASRKVPSKSMIDYIDQNIEQFQKENREGAESILQDLID